MILMTPAPSELELHELVALRATGQFERGGTMYYTIEKIGEELCSAERGRILYFKTEDKVFEGWMLDIQVGFGDFRAYDNQGAYTYFNVTKLKWILL